MSVCIFPGRFQPFNKGQMMVVKGMISTCSRAVIVICYDENDDKEDLWNSEEVREMISAALLDENIMDAEIKLVSDCAEDDEWVDKILEAVDHTEESLVWSGNENVLNLFEKHNVATKKVSPVPGIINEEIRAKIKNKEKGWQDKVSIPVQSFIERNMR